MLISTPFLDASLPPLVTYVLLLTDYTHVIFIGANEPTRMLSALARYNAGGAGYVDPVAFDDVFEFVDGVPSVTFVPMITVRYVRHMHAMQLHALYNQKHVFFWGGVGTSAIRWRCTDLFQRLLPHLLGELYLYPIPKLIFREMKV